jgi:hypothetical protein
LRVGASGRDFGWNFCGRAGKLDDFIGRGQ